MAHLTIDFFSNCLRRTVQFQMIIPGDFCNTWQIEQKRKGKRMKTLFLLHGYTGAAPCHRIFRNYDRHAVTEPERGRSRKKQLRFNYRNIDWNRKKQQWK